MIARTCGGDKSEEEDASTDEEEEEEEDFADSEMEAVANDGDEHAKRLFRGDFVFAYATICNRSMRLGEEELWPCRAACATCAWLGANTTGTENHHQGSAPCCEALGLGTTA